jgi:hypothetical protein
VRIWAADVAVGQVIEYVEDHAVLSIIMKSGAAFTVESPLRGTK